MNAPAAKQKPSLTCITPEGIVSFPNLWKAKAFQPGKEPQFGLLVVFEGTTDLAKLKDVIRSALVGKFGPEWKAKHPNLRIPIRRAEEYVKYGEPFDKAGRLFISASSRTQPGVVNRSAEPIIDQGQTYAGMLARVSVYAHAYDTAGNKGVTLLLNNVQKTGEGKRLSGRMPAEMEFERLDDNVAGVDDLVG